MTFLRVFIREYGDHSSRFHVLARLQRGLLRSPTDNRPHVSLGIYLQIPKPVKSPIFIRPGGRAVARRGGRAVARRGGCKIFRT
jgi:hypothetical protein